MRRSSLMLSACLLLPALALSACSNEQPAQPATEDASEPDTAADVIAAAEESANAANDAAEQAAPEAASRTAPPVAPTQPVLMDEIPQQPPGAGGLQPGTMPELQYNHAVSYKLDADKVPLVQDSHTAICAQAGPTSCQLVSQQQDVEASGEQAGQLVMNVRQDQVNNMVARMTSVVNSAGGDRIAINIASSDATDDIANARDITTNLQTQINRREATIRSKNASAGAKAQARRELEGLRNQMQSSQRNLDRQTARVAISQLTITYMAASSWWGPLGYIMGIIALIALVCAVWFIARRKPASPLADA